MGRSSSVPLQHHASCLLSRSAIDACTSQGERIQSSGSEHEKLDEAENITLCPHTLLES